MQVPAAPWHTVDPAVLAPFTDDRCLSGPVPLDGTHPAYAVLRGHAEIVAAPRRIGDGPSCRAQRLGTVEAGAVVPSSTALGAWQLVLVPGAGTSVRSLSVDRLREVGYGAVAEPPDPGPIPVPRGASAPVQALARGIDATLRVLAAALRTGSPPAHAVAIRPGQIVSLESGAVVRGAPEVGWVRVAGGHGYRNDELDTVFGGTEPALLAGDDWIVVDGPATAEATPTTDLLVAGQLPGVLDQHLVCVLRTIARRFG